MISFATPDMERQDVSKWTNEDWRRKRMTVIDGRGVMADIVWQRQKSWGTESPRIFGERKMEKVLERDEHDCLVEMERLMLIKYDGDTRQEVEEMSDSLVIWLRPCGYFYDEWDREKDAMAGFREKEMNEKGMV